MFKILLISTLLSATAYCELLGFEDTEALLIAQEKSGALLEPPKEVYEKIHKDLAAIRKAFPVVANVKHHSPYVAGRITCQKFTKDAATKLNDSEFGPITEHRMEMSDYDVITFSKPYNSPKLIQVLAEKGLATQCSVDRLIGISSQVSVGPDNTYVFYKGSGDCPAGCINKHFWTFSVKDETVTLVKETGNGIENSRA